MDDLSDETARRRVFRGVHRTPKPFEEEAGLALQNHDESSPAVSRSVEDPHEGFFDAGETDIFSDGLAGAGAHRDDEEDPYFGAPPLPYASRGSNPPGTAMFAQDDDPSDEEDTLRAGTSAFFDQPIRHTARPSLDTAPGARSVPLPPPPDAQDDLSEPSLIFGNRDSEPDLIDTLRSEITADDTPQPKAYPGPRFPQVDAFPQGLGSPIPVRDHGAAFPLRAESEARSIPDIHATPDDAAAAARSNTSSGVVGAPDHRTDHATTSAVQGPPDLSFTLSYERQDGVPASDDRAVDGNPAAALSDGTHESEGRGARAIGRSEPQEQDAAASAGPAAGSSAGPREGRTFHLSDDDLANLATLQSSARTRAPRYKIIAGLAAIVPVIVGSTILYLHRDGVERADGTPGTFRSATSVRDRDASPHANDPAGASSPAPPGAAPPGAAPPGAAPQPGGRPNGAAPLPSAQPSPESEVPLKGVSPGIPKLMDDPLPILTELPPASSAATDRIDDGQAAASDSRAPLPQGPDHAAPDNPGGMRLSPADQLGTAPRPGRKAAPDEGRRTVTAPLQEPAPTSTDADVPRSQRLTARHKRSRSNPQDDALNVRAERLLAAGEILAARAAFQSLVSAGDPRGARGVAQTYDQRVLNRFPASGVKPDPDEAARWQALGARLETRQRKNPGDASP